MTDKTTHTPLPGICRSATEETIPCPAGHTGTTLSNINIYGTWWVRCSECSWRTAGETEAEALTAWNTRAVNSHHDLIEALRAARKIIADIDDYMKRPSRGDWGEECACCMGELLDDDRDRITKIDAIITKAEAGHG